MKGLTSRRVLGLAGLLGAIVLVVLLGTGLGWWDTTASQGAPSAPLAVSTSLSPASSLFGDPVQARVVVGLDTRSVSGSTLTVEPDFAPYVVAGPPAIRRSRTGSDETVAYTYSLQCETNGCLPTSGPLAIHFQPVAVAVAAGAKQIKATGRWPDLVVSSRLQHSDLVASSPPFRHPATAPPVAYRIDPGALADGLTVAAVLFGLVALLLLVRELSALADRRRRSARQSPLESALALVRQAAGREDPADRRKALELLAEALTLAGRPALAGSAGDVAWAEAEPSPARALELADEAESDAATQTMGSA